MAGAVNAVFAVGRHGEFALSDGSLPWRTVASLEADARRDMEHFKRLTAGCAVVMGFGTYRTLPRPLVGRLNVVIDRNAHNAERTAHDTQGAPLDAHRAPLELSAQGEECFYFLPTLQAALTALRTLPVRVFLIGGKRLFECAFSSGLVDGTVYQTVFDATFPQATVFFALPGGLELQKSERVGRLTFSEYKVRR